MLQSSEEKSISHLYGTKTCRNEFTREETGFFHGGQWGVGGNACCFIGDIQ